MDSNNLATMWSTIGIGAASAAATYAMIRFIESKNKLMRHALDDHITRQYENPAFLESPERHQTQVYSRRADPYDPKPRSEYLSWDDYFMAVAFLSSQRSKDPNKQVGACIVNQNNVICGIGYNGFPRGCPDSKLPWSKLSRSGSKLDTKYPYVCHAEMNAILNKNGASVVGSKVYVTMFPCNECAKLMIQAGISEIVFHEDKAQPRAETPGASNFKLADQYAASKKLLSLAGIKIRQHLFRRPIHLVLSNDGLSPLSCMSPSKNHPTKNICQADDIDSRSKHLVTRFDDEKI